MIMRSKATFLAAARRNPAIIVAFLLILLSMWALFPRLEAERAARSTAVILDYRDLIVFANRDGASPDALWQVLEESGASGLMVSELTGQQLSLGAVDIFYGPAAGLPSQAAALADENPARAALFIPRRHPAIQLFPALASARFPGASVREYESGTAVLLTRSSEELLSTGVLPDIEGLLLAARLDIPVFYRVAPALSSDAEASLSTLGMLLDAFPQIRTVSPSGEVALGFPRLRPLAELIVGKGRTVAMVEFSRQIGATQLNWLSFPHLLPLHSVTNEEILSRNISRFALYERFVRAVKERAVRLLVFRPSVMEAADAPLDVFVGELRRLAGGLSAFGSDLRWPEPFQPWRTGFSGALALALAFVFSMLRFLQRFFLLPAGDEPDDDSLAWRTTPRGLALFSGIVIFAGAVIFFLPSAARIAGALTAVFVVTEASFLALDGWRTPWLGLLGSFLFAVAGGLAIAAFFSDPTYMLRLRSFSGVKATLFLPPLLVLMADLKRRVHPESLGDIFRRPPLWGELFLVILLIGTAGLVLFRSDNVQFVPAFEVRLRELLERALVARPRNKEVFLGYPALLIWYFVRKADLWPRYREVFRMGTVIGFSSAVNSFCHFHTPLYFILFRQFNGLWTGVLLGMICIVLLRFVILPLWDRYGRMVTE